MGGNPNYPISTGGSITYDSNKMVRYGDWYAGATVKYLGGMDASTAQMVMEIGDYLFIIKEDGTYFPMILQDTKAQQAFELDSNPANEWGHENGACVVELETQYPNTNVGNLKNGRTAQIYRVRKCLQ